jgi:ABC-2 type transport system ATP-binding protein
VTNYAIECSSLRVVRGGVEVLPDLSFSIRGGTVVGLLGPSGCGKSTLMRAIVGTQIVESGQITVLGRPAGHPALRRSVGYGTQAAAVYSDLTVTENLHYFAAALGAPVADVRRVLDQVDLGRFADRVAGRLSGGQRSRVSLAIALLGRPELIVLDEPTVGLDPVLRERLWALFHDIVADGATLLVSSHVMDEAERCHELLLMREGRLVTQSSPAELKQRTGTSSMDAAFLNLISEGANA